MSEPGSWTPSPCLGLDVHKSTTTATYLGPDGKTKRVWTIPTTREALRGLSTEIDPATPLVLEASTAGKAVASFLKQAGRELHMAAPREVALIAKSTVKTDKRDSAKLAHLFQAGFLPECYIPPPEIDRMRFVVRQRQDLGRKLSVVKNQVHALVTRNLQDEALSGVADIFGVRGIQRLTRLDLPPDERAALARYLQQLTYLADQEEELQRTLAHLATDREDVRLLMSIPGISYYTAVALVAEIGDIRRFSRKAELASYAGLVPRADNSGNFVSSHRHVKPGDMVLKSFLCSAVMGMMLARQETTIKRFYRKKVRQIGQPKAQVAAARKLSAVVWWVLTNRQPYREQDEALSERKGALLDRTAAIPSVEVDRPSLELLGAQLSGKVEALDRLSRESGADPDFEEKREGSG